MFIKKFVVSVISVAIFLASISSHTYIFAYSDAKKIPDISGMSYKEAFLAVAQSQIGYREDSQGRTIYSEWADQSGQGWCAEFAAWCARQANIPTSIIPTELSASHYQEAFAKMGRYYMVDAGAKHIDCICENVSKSSISVNDIKPGDIVLTISRNIGGNAINHTAICLSNENGQLVTIDGNINDSVDTCNRDYNTVHGICRPDYEAEANLKDVSKLRIEMASSFTFSGKEIKPKVNVYDGYQKLLENTDYRLIYSDNKLPGIASVSITGRCDYTGNTVIHFDIKPKKIANLSAVDITNSSITLSWEKDTNVSGYEIQMYKKGKWKTVKRTSGNKQHEQRFIGLKSGKMYKFRIRSFKTVSDTTIYGKYSAITVKTIK